MRVLFFLSEITFSRIIGACNSLREWKEKSISLAFAVLLNSFWRTRRVISGHSLPAIILPGRRREEGRLGRNERLELDGQTRERRCCLEGKIRRRAGIITVAYKVTQKHAPGQTMMHFRCTVVCRYYARVAAAAAAAAALVKRLHRS